MISPVEAIVWPLVGGIGLLLLLTAQPIGRPRPSLAARLAALRPDAAPQVREATSFASPTLERLLVPPLRAAGSLGLRLAELLGVPTGRLARRLRLAGEPGGPALHVGQKVFGALVGLGLLPVFNQIGVTPFGRWPAWLWLAAGVAGFLTPDADLARKIARRRRELLVGLGAASEFLALAVSAGCGLEQALVEAAQAGSGPFFAELSHRLSLARLEGQQGVDAISQMAQEIDLPELAALAGAVQAGARQGTPVLQTLRAQAQAARERRRLGLLEAGERAQVTMIVPVATLIFPAFFLVILWPASVALLRLSNS
jgi:tight adherence protein C